MVFLHHSDPPGEESDYFCVKWGLEIFFLFHAVIGLRVSGQVIEAIWIVFELGGNGFHGTAGS